jgi:DNA (cytosine-5)-methyltransferase 1
MARQMAMRLHSEDLIVDCFAGGGGASLGIEWALGRSPDIAINHDREAIAMHAENHPTTKHYCEDVHEVDPAVAAGGRGVALAWFSPDCTHFSQCLGGKPRSKGIRSLAWVVIRWARAVRPRIICLENVAEFADWGPLDEHGHPIKDLAGFEFRQWWSALAAEGYAIEMRILKGCDFGAPTTRERLFIIARCDGEAIVWPEPTHGPGRLPYLTAASCIEWGLPCPSIFLTREEATELRRATGIVCKRPLVENTMRRIAVGVRRHVLETAEPFIIPVTHPRDQRVHSIREPFRTITAANRGELAYVAPTLIQTGYGERPGQTPRALDLHRPLGTVVAGGAKHALVAAFLELAYGEQDGGWNGSRDLGRPFATVTGRDHHRLVASFGVKLRGTSDAHIAASSFASGSPAPTITASGNHLYEVRAFLDKYYGSGAAQAAGRPLDTITTRDRFSVVQVAGQGYAIADIGMRMLIARELFRAQGFPDSYAIDVVLYGKRITETAKTACAGNSVCPVIPRAIVQANYTQRARVEAA